MSWQTSSMDHPLDHSGMNVWRPAGAEQRAYDLEDRLRSTQRQAAGFDEAQSSLIEQSQLLVGMQA
jgi:hypothetical protein